MKAEELMLGDWVFLDGVPSRVGLIEANPQTVYVKNERLGIRVDMEDVDPIPLTAEILEANGFVKTREQFRHIQYELTLNPNTEDEHYVVVKLHPKNDHCPYMWAHIFYLPTSRIELNTIESKIVDCSVHHFQHILRLCGIDKEITIIREL